ncbi:MAG TPA: DUF5009 domain-containing protein [Phycisphaerae bacterium]|jgi:predicted acyltransferase|nr:DUF5009 domain-containing protein [Phycisphaerae bacterium]HOB74387.1 DUF5009 domain-containing protein [Phycisphaerae bacterium]HOJ54494.1 DUF5009 domain-containing protein [Phycisphaerae bacterium]HOL26523.1 DUF5009 domain-containing protein [Phycisphaerae bacterium]HPP20922.1 DUF5009 domain-containing protein [Phycisphaerae bacterium]
MGTTTTLSTPYSSRLTSLDVFRGLTLAGMILVNNPGSWAHVFGPLRHAQWHGWTPTDLVFPFFLFIVGTAIPLAFDKRRALGESRSLLLLHATRRAIVLFTLGLAYSGVTIKYVNGLAGEGQHWQVILPWVLTVLALAFIWPEEKRIAQDGWGRHVPRMVLAGFILLAGVFALIYFWEDFQRSEQRIPGVLQRIAICYLLASIIVLYFGVPGRVFWTVACLVGYWALLRYVSPPGDFNPKLEGPEGRLHEWIDIHVLGRHLYRARPDPEGILSTLPAVATTLLGVLTGDWLRSGRDEAKKGSGLLLAGMIGIIVGLILHQWIPINKKIWTSSYVLFAGGCAAYVLGWCYLLVDGEGWQRWSKPFLVLGTNAIAVYVLSSLTGWFLAAWPLLADGTLNVKTWLYNGFFGPRFGPEGGSLAYALCYVLVWIIIFTPLYRARIYIRV